MPNGRRVQPPEEEDFPAVDAYGELQARISELEDALARLPVQSEGIGHNRPPEPIEDDPLNADDRALLTNILAALKAQPSEPAPDALIEIERSPTVVSGLGKKVQDWLSKHADNFVSEAVKEAGKETGKWTTRLVVWSVIAEKLTDLSVALGHWLQGLHLPF